MEPTMTLPKADAAVRKARDELEHGKKRLHTVMWIIAVVIAGAVWMGSAQAHEASGMHRADHIDHHSAQWKPWRVGYTPEAAHRVRMEVVDSKDFRWATYPSDEKLRNEWWKHVSQPCDQARETVILLLGEAAESWVRVSILDENRGAAQLFGRVKVDMGEATASYESRLESYETQASYCEADAAAEIWSTAKEKDPELYERLETAAGRVSGLNAEIAAAQWE